MAHSSTLLLIDNDRELVGRLQQAAANDSYEVRAVESLEGAVAWLREGRPAAVVVDFGVSPKEGLAAVRRCHEACPGALLLGTSANPTDEVVDAARGNGAEAVLAKPYSPQTLLLVLREITRRRALEADQRDLRELVENRNFLGDLRGGSQAMNSIYRLIDEVAPSDLAILIHAEPGCELEAAAQTVHRVSRRGQRAALELDLKRVEPEDAERILFGGADSASRDAPSLVEQADESTLILHEIARLTPTAQHRLMNVLDEKTVLRSGVLVPRRANFCSGATTTENLFERTVSGTFRRDLYYRINVVQMLLPPLRERLEDIPMLVWRALNRANKLLETRVEGVSLEALYALGAYSWPGNLEELQEAVRAAVRNAKRGVVTPQHLPLAIYQAAAASDNGEARANIPFREAKHRFELEYFSDLLRRTKGNMTQAAEISGVGRPYLYKKLQEYKLKPSDFRKGRG